MVFEIKFALNLFGWTYLLKKYLNNSFLVLYSSFGKNDKKELSSERGTHNNQLLCVTRSENNNNGNYRILNPTFFFIS